VFLIMNALPIASGAYGEGVAARNMVGTLAAVKIVPARSTPFGGIIRARVQGASKIRAHFPARMKVWSIF